MARINIDDELFADGRFVILKKLTGSEEVAIGKLVIAWRTAQAFWLKDELIPHRFWEILKLDELVQTGFAEVHDAGVYVNGTEKHFDWLKQKQAAGIRSGEVRRAKVQNSKSGPKCERNTNGTRTEGERNTNGRATKKEPLTLTLTHNIYIPDLDQLYSAYPRKEGKKKGYANFQRVITSEQIFNEVLTAIKNYANECQGKDKQYIKHFDTFSNCWEDYLEIQPSEKDLAISALLEMQQKAETEYLALKTGEVQNA